MATPSTDRFVPVAPLPADAVLLPTDVRTAIADIAGAAGACCPALTPEGDRVAYVTDRSGSPRLEVAALDGSSVPVPVSAPDQEVVSVAWSPDGGRPASLVGPGGSICAERHVVRPDGTGSRRLAGEDPRAWPDLFAAGATLAGTSDLQTFFAGTEPWMAAGSVTEYADPVADREMLAAISPTTAVGRHHPGEVSGRTAAWFDRWL